MEKKKLNISEENKYNEVKFTYEYSAKERYCFSLVISGHPKAECLQSQQNESQAE